MGEVKPIETRYAGCRFRSRLEARWAVFLDRLGVPWEYEPQGFTINGEPYLPDFLVYPNTEFAFWLEIKGSFPSEVELAKARGLAEGADVPVYVYWAKPEPPAPNFGAMTAEQYCGWDRGGYVWIKWPPLSTATRSCPQANVASLSTGTSARCLPTGWTLRSRHTRRWPAVRTCPGWRRTRRTVGSPVGCGTPRSWFRSSGRWPAMPETPTRDWLAEVIQRGDRSRQGCPDCCCGCTCPTHAAEAVLDACRALVDAEVRQALHGAAATLVAETGRGEHVAGLNRAAKIVRGIAAAPHLAGGAR